MTEFLLRGMRLARSNPRVFLQRLGMIVRRPIRNTRALMSIARRREQIETAYREWLSTSVASDDSSISGNGPVISVLMPVYNVDEELLIAAMESVIAQSYGSWELCIADDASTQPHIREVLEQYASLHERIRVVFREHTGHIAAASNTALEQATGEFVVLLDHDDILMPAALAHVAAVIQECPAVDFIYSDEDKIDEAGKHRDPFFKPGWSPTLLTSCNYITHLAAIRRSVVQELGGFRDETVGSQDHDLFLRVGEVARAVAHIPRILYSWRMAPGSTARGTSAKPYAIEASRRAVGDAVERRGLRAEVTQTHLNGIFFVRHSVPSMSISLIISGVDTAWHRLRVSALLDIQDVVYLNPSAPAARGLPRGQDISSLRGEYLVWIDSASRPTGQESVQALVEQLQSPNVAVAGGMTERRGSVLQAGLVLGEQGQPGFAYSGLPLLPHRNMYLNLKDLPHEVGAVWVGCCAMRAEAWAAHGGWNPSLPPDLAMVDLCLRANATGHSVVYTPLARFRRHTPLPPITQVSTVEWPWTDAPDPLSSPNLDPSTPDGLPFRHGEERVSALPAGGSAVPV